MDDVKEHAAKTSRKTLAETSTYRKALDARLEIVGGCSHIGEEKYNYEKLVELSNYTQCISNNTCYIGTIYIRFNFGAV